MLIVLLFENVAEYLRYRTQLVCMELMDDRLLHDIGLERGELRAAAWQAVHGEAR